MKKPSLHSRHRASSRLHRKHPGNDEHGSHLPLSGKKPSLHRVQCVELQREQSVSHAAHPPFSRKNPSPQTSHALLTGLHWRHPGMSHTVCHGSLQRQLHSPSRRYVVESQTVQCVSSEHSRQCSTVEHAGRQMVRRRPLHSPLRRNVPFAQTAHAWDDVAHSLQFSMSHSVRQRCRVQTNALALDGCCSKRALFARIVGVAGRTRWMELLACWWSGKRDKNSCTRRFEGSLGENTRGRPTTNCTRHTPEGSLRTEHTCHCSRNTPIRSLCIQCPTCIWRTPE